MNGGCDAFTTELYAGGTELMLQEERIRRGSKPESMSQCAASLIRVQKELVYVQRVVQWTSQRKRLAKSREEIYIQALQQPEDGRVRSSGRLGRWGIVGRSRGGGSVRVVVVDAAPSGRSRRPRRPLVALPAGEEAGIVGFRHDSGLIGLHPKVAAADSSCQWAFVRLETVLVKWALKETDRKKMSVLGCCWKDEDVGLPAVGGGGPPFGNVCHHCQASQCSQPT
ncbi:hypothetical protein B0H17DRAFT_1188252 [Mycena rosella]|uniref:Uncharacterized protein n=1 Tax=Mycena rosella TaxID=1033263 RepID=A0AAD7FKD2_MYCRO|nr:hypothetical protein B0H17DRAFT_1188252 [Mycena rosella]